MKTIQIHTPDWPNYWWVLSHELSHAVQNCVSLPPSDDTGIAKYANHDNWVRDHIVDAIVTISWGRIP